ncbi:hypothetical protein TWF225_005748 [Orbilia oligospora]|nr:hypothetical protein TWF225_005748 [Orbilia oligospora]KAF3271328.1 hypothetical protein TWF217_005726 [Orbilia oligospora]KAF3271886.1 hypothetical protein TWF128_000412 [Orbilia oligospora]KAF3293535.1 hypothetical protein TWF132_004503 [Orbilia oligospora]
MGNPTINLNSRNRRVGIGALAATFLLCYLSWSNIFHSYHHLSVPHPTTSSPGFLPIEDALKFCENRRWEIWRHRSRRRKIYDLILVNTELDWLEIRLGQMYDQVDYFVILEANLTFQDTPKPLFVKESWDRFEKYHSKMIRHTLSIKGVKFENTWDREKFSRNAMYDQVVPYLKGRQAPNMGDVILVSDVDEVPRPSTLTALRNCKFPKKLSLHSDMYYYGFQWRKRGDWAFPQATFYDGNNTVRPDDLRGTADSHLYRAAWHCSYCFSTIGEFVKKLNSFSHAELNRDTFKDTQQILQHVRDGIDLYNREGEQYDRIEDNPDVPEFLKENKEKYLYMFDRDPENANFVDLQYLEEPADS